MEQAEEQKLGRKRIYMVGARRGMTRIYEVEVVFSHTSVANLREIELASGAEIW
jgi:hypothetical protein